MLYYDSQKKEDKKIIHVELCSALGMLSIVVERDCDRRSHTGFVTLVHRSQPKQFRLVSILELLLHLVPHKRGE